MPSLFAVLSVAYSVTATGVEITAITDVACHLWFRWSNTPWDVHLVSEPVRGTAFSTKPYYCIVAYEDNEQEEAGDTLTHTFIKEPWAHCETRYFHFWGEIGGQPSPSESCLLDYHRVQPPFGPPVTLTFYPDPNPEITSVDGYVMQVTGPSTWTFLVNAPGNAANDRLSRTWIGFKTHTGAGTFEVLARTISLFDTTPLPADCFLSSAKLSYRTYQLYAQNGSSPAFNIVSSNPVSNIALAFADYATLGGVKFSTDVPYAALALEARTEFALNAAGLAAITRGGISKFGVREVNYDLPDNTPPWNGANLGDYWVPYSTDYLLAYKPFLEVTYQMPL